MAYQIFISHTKADKEFCDMFDVLCARVGIKSFRSEFENIGIPQYKTIKEAMEKSIAMFLMVGKQLVAHQASPTPAWKYTQNWIAYETGLACQKGIDVWVLCDDGVEINFPVPYFNNYASGGLKPKDNFEFIRGILSAYNTGGIYTASSIDSTHIKCTNESCGIDFNLYPRLPAGKTIKCPQCLSNISYPLGMLLGLLNKT